MGVNEIDPFAPQVHAQAPGAAPIETRTAPEQVHLAADRTQLGTPRPKLIETKIANAVLISRQVLAHAQRQAFGASDRQTVQQVANVR